MALSSYKYALIAPRLEKILAQNAAPKVPAWQSFLKKRKRGTKGNFSNIAQKKPLLERPKSTLAQLI